MHYWFPYPEGRICEFCNEIQSQFEFEETVCWRADAYLRPKRPATIA